MEEKERYELIGYCSYRDTETGVIGDNFVGLLNQQDQKIKDLEAKLAESEKETERIRRNWQISKTHQQKLYNNLKQQNKSKGIVNYPITLDGCRIADEEQLLDFAKDFCLEKKYWQKQIAEKEKLLRQKISKMKSTDFIRMCKECGFMVKAKENDNQTAIDELEKVKNFLLEKIAEKQSCFDSGNYNDFADGVKTICELMLISIDNQIKSLKGEK